jgi:hypothetical protein
MFWRNRRGKEESRQLLVAATEDDLIVGGIDAHLFR